MATITQVKGQPISIVWDWPNFTAAELTRLSTKYLDRLDKELATRVKEQMLEQVREAVLTGVWPPDTAVLLQKTFGDVLHSTQARMINIARTEQLDAYRAGGQAFQRANRDIMAGWQWVSVLAETTCASCIAMHGTMHDIDEPGPEDHPQGRCFRRPVTKTWEELGFPGVDSPPSLVPDAEEWFKGLSPESQEKILGGKAYEAWREGKFPRSEWAKRVQNPGWRPSYIPAKP